MSAINVMVEAIVVETVEIKSLGEVEGRIVPGRTSVQFRTSDGQAFDLDWTMRGVPPSTGSMWTLSPEGSA